VNGNSRPRLGKGPESYVERYIDRPGGLRVGRARIFRRGTVPRLTEREHWFIK